MLEIERNIFQIFPINIFVEKNFLSDNQCDLVMEALQAETVTEYHALKGDAKSSYSVFSKYGILDKMPDSLSDLQYKIQERIDYFTNVSNIHACELGYSWFNIQNEQSQLSMHSHGFSVVSGALYINTDEFSSTLDFLNPNYSSFSGFYGDDSLSIFRNKVERGSLFLFPSYLVHGNIENKSKNRIVIAFNTFLKYPKK